MSKATQEQRDKFRFALEDKGVPEVIAFMAAGYADVPYLSPHEYDAEDLIAGFFFWGQTKEGLGFWVAVEDNCRHWVTESRKTLPRPTPVSGPVTINHRGEVA